MASLSGYYLIDPTGKGNDGGFEAMGMETRGKGLARQFQALLDSGAIGSLDDGDLLGRFLRRDAQAELAFEALVNRHGRMVWRVCRDVLGDSHEAQDAAQATFFILARKARAIRDPESLPSWLHGTARRVASRALRDKIRRRRLDRMATMRPAESADEAARQGWPELHEELARLPSRYRDPIVLCDLSGLTHEQAAGQLGCPPRTLETRLYRGRERLKGRLIRRGVAPLAGLVGVAWPSGSSGAIPLSWAPSTARAGVQLAGTGGWAAAGKVPANAARWAQIHLQELTMSPLKWFLASSLMLALGWQFTRSAAPPQTEPVPQAKAGPAVSSSSLPKPGTHPITVTGRAIDAQGKILSYARIYIASRWADYKRLAETSTDAEGKYEFRAVPLPIERADTVIGEDQGRFQVFGESAGHGFAFRPMKTFYPFPKPTNITYEPVFIDPPASYRTTDKIVLDLTFPPAARLVGTILDAQGDPLPDIRLEIRACEPLIAVDGAVGVPFDTLNEPDSAPASMKLRTTDALGRFEFADMPTDCRFRIAIRAKGFPNRSIYAATTRAPQPDHAGSPVRTGDMEIVLERPVDVPIKVVYADSLMPAPRVAVQAAAAEVSILETSDEQGIATLRLPAGSYRMEYLPARGTPYLVTEAELVVGDLSPPEPKVYQLRLAAELDVTVVDEATGAGIPGVDLWHQSGDRRRERFCERSWEVATRTAWVDHPKTDAQGRIHALIEPGKHHFGIGDEAPAKGYQIPFTDGKDVEGRAGEAVSLKFVLKKLVPADRAR